MRVVRSTGAGYSNLPTTFGRDNLTTSATVESFYYDSAATPGNGYALKESTNRRTPVIDDNLRLLQSMGLVSNVICSAYKGRCIASLRTFRSPSCVVVRLANGARRVDYREHEIWTAPP